MIDYEKLKLRKWLIDQKNDCKALYQAIGPEAVYGASKAYEFVIKYIDSLEYDIQSNQLQVDIDECHPNNFATVGSVLFKCDTCRKTYWDIKVDVDRC